MEQPSFKANNTSDMVFDPSDVFSMDLALEPGGLVPVHPI